MLKHNSYLTRYKSWSKEEFIFSVKGIPFSKSSINGNTRRLYSSNPVTRTTESPVSIRVLDFFFLPYFECWTINSRIIVEFHNFYSFLIDLLLLFISTNKIYFKTQKNLIFLKKRALEIIEGSEIFLIIRESVYEHVNARGQFHQGKS